MTELAQKLEAFREDPDTLSRTDLVDLVRGADEEVQLLRELLWSPQNEAFLEGALREAGHQVARWGVEHDADKEPENWLFLIGHLASKACQAARTGNQGKALHHTISTAAACANWHAYLKGEPPLSRRAEHASAPAVAE